MALLDTGDIAQRVAALLDDPAQTTFTQDYLLPFINQRWDDINSDLVALSLQFEEAFAELLAVPPGTSSLSSYMSAGQSLAALMSPKSVDWKLAGADPTEYEEVLSVNELDDMPVNTVEVAQYAWIGGTLYVTPCSVPVDIRVRYNAMSTSLVDPTSQIIVGIGNVLVYRVAELVWTLQGNDGGKMAAYFERKGDAALDSFCALANMRTQATLSRFKRTHQRFVAYAPYSRRS